MAVTLDFVAAVANRPRRFARLIDAETEEIIDLPWWPDEVAVSRISPNWTEQPRPGRKPLLVNESQQLAQMSVGFIATATYSDRGDYDQHAWEVIGSLQSAASLGHTVYLLLGVAYRTTPWKITELGWTELDWTPWGNVSRAEVSMTLTRVSEASQPRGPVTARKHKKVDGHQVGRKFRPTNNGLTWGPT